MKKYILFAIIFILLFSITQVLSGVLLTFLYTPDLKEVWNMSDNSPRETVITSSSTSFMLTLFIAFLSATISYFITNKITNFKNNVK
ncbi:hypothetical protein CEY16_03045 [Halalkalibacillus sediminis]|uniref:Uncharacterized protein n=1 Tax=Halalkalibacillus sediminis TaxID=2018042 RepID=A0A2I0QWQ6_9BACI|nr:hypothetical protein [Halalkalibacillus sediminis]PKR78748.1 hypothetical protein CEY16_03045 [Halalkalibacillus sediminis]